MRALIVEDERLSRIELRRLLEDFPDVEIVGEAANAAEAEAAIEALAPDLLFLDIQMPDRTGFELLEDLDAAPDVIFTTAYDRYALRAFEVNALDYLLKPIEPERLAEALARVRAQRPPAGQPGDAPTPLSADDQVFVKDGERCWFVHLRDVRLFESVGNYTCLYFDGHKPLIHRTLSYLEERLDPAVFFRANRAQIINLRRVRDIATTNSGLAVRLEDGTRVEMSRRRAQDFRIQMSL